MLQQGGGDDTATGCARLFGCGYMHDGQCLSSWGGWRAEQHCAAGEKICGIQTRVEAPVNCE